MNKVEEPAAFGTVIGLANDNVPCVLSGQRREKTTRGPKMMIRQKMKGSKKTDAKRPKDKRFVR